MFIAQKEINILLASIQDRKNALMNYKNNLTQEIQMVKNSDLDETTKLAKINLGETNFNEISLEIIMIENLQKKLLEELNIYLNLE